MSIQEVNRIKNHYPPGTRIELIAMNDPYDRCFWNEGPQSKGLNDKVDWLKDNHLWLEVRETYLTKKNLYLSRGDRNHPSFNCYIEAVNEVFHKYR